MSPYVPGLKLRLANCSQAQPLEGISRQEEHSSDLESNQLILTNRTVGGNSFELTTKSDISTGVIKDSGSIKSYVRMKPSPSVSFLPFEVYNSRSIVCDRAVYKFDCVFLPDTEQVIV